MSPNEFLNIFSNCPFCGNKLKTYGFKIGCSNFFYHNFNASKYDGNMDNPFDKQYLEDLKDINAIMIRYNDDIWKLSLEYLLIQKFNNKFNNGKPVESFQVSSEQEIFRFIDGLAFAQCL